MPISVRTRFEIFKRDDFTCRYCGRMSPEVVLEIDHIIPVCEKGSDDPINLAVACWECNRGKSGVSLSEQMTGEDPHDRAILLLEKERQLREYNEVLRVINERIEASMDALCDFWGPMKVGDRTSIRNALSRYPEELIFRAMTVAVENRRTAGMGYVHACLKNWTQDEQDRQRA